MYVASNKCVPVATIHDLLWLCNNYYYKCSDDLCHIIIMCTPQVGRALAISALDMYQLNPWSRLPTTEYGSVAGIRQSLIQRIRTSRSKKYNNYTIIVIALLIINVMHVYI